jgi:hypothetical protein
VIGSSIMHLFKSHTRITTNRSINPINFVDLSHSLKRDNDLSLRCSGSAAQSGTST